MRGKPLPDYKHRYLPAFGITTRMFNAVVLGAGGQGEGAHEARKRHARRLKAKIRSRAFTSIEGVPRTAATRTNAELAGMES